MRWANTCCSHASPADELLVTAAERRLQEEFGFTLPLREAGSFVYRATDPDNALTEYEHDTVLIGSARGVLSLKPDPTEIADWRWMRVAALERDLRDNPARYAPWLPAALRVSLRDSRARSST